MPAKNIFSNVTNGLKNHYQRVGPPRLPGHHQHSYSTFSVSLISLFQMKKAELDFHLLGKQHPINITKEKRPLSSQSKESVIRTKRGRPTKCQALMEKGVKA